ncbi:MAG: hypothetical protein ACK55Z_25535, partial [bacterium]
IEVSLSWRAVCVGCLVTVFLILHPLGSHTCLGTQWHAFKGLRGSDLLLKRKSAIMSMQQACEMMGPTAYDVARPGYRAAGPGTGSATGLWAH